MQTARVMARFEPVVQDVRPDLPLAGLTDDSNDRVIGRHRRAGAARRRPRRTAHDATGESGLIIPSTTGLRPAIEDCTAVVGVIGLGYVGLPLAVESARSGFRTIGFDVGGSMVRAPS